MSSADLFVKIDSLPEDLRRQVTDFIEFLLHRKQADHTVPNGGRPTPVPGLAKGKVVIPDDFDAPLDDFKEYME